MELSYKPIALNALRDCMVWGVPYGKCVTLLEKGILTVSHKDAVSLVDDYATKIAGVCVVKKDTKESLLLAIDICEEASYNTEDTISYMQIFAEVNYECASKFLEAVREVKDVAKV